MSNLFQVLLGSFIGSFLALSGAVALLWNKKSAATLANLVTPFAAGALLATAFFDLLPEAIENSGETTASSFILIGLVTFFILERFLHWFHHTHGSNEHGKSHTAPLIIIGDTVHNALDGVAIAAAFLVSPTAGFIASFAVAMHEVPQEIGDFGLLLQLGYSRSKALVINMLSAFSTTPVALGIFAVGQNQNLPIGPLIGLTAGFFIYIAVADLIPRIHSNTKRHFAEAETILLILGIVLVALATHWTHGFIET